MSKKDKEKQKELIDKLYVLFAYTVSKSEIKKRLKEKRAEWKKKKGTK